jgi:adenine-specific DNA-methyltransferase
MKNKTENIEQFSLTKDLPKFPTTRYQGSKRKIVPQLAVLLGNLSGRTLIDLFSGSGTVSLLARFLDKSVIANDYMRYNSNTADLFLNFDSNNFTPKKYAEDLDHLLYQAPFKSVCLVEKNYSGIYFKDAENLEIDRFCQNISDFPDQLKKLYIYAVGQALIKKRPYNLFHRANLEMRTKDVERSFGNAKTWETSIKEHALKCINELFKFPTHNCEPNHKATCVNTSNLSQFPKDIDIVYLDPPYINGKGQAVDYSDFYNFLEGLMDYELFSQGDQKYPHKPIAKKSSNWSMASTAKEELTSICEYWKSSVIILSYRSDGVPTPEELANVMSIGGRRVEIHSAGEYQYALSSNKENEELFILSFPL